MIEILYIISNVNCWIRYDELLEMIEGSREELSGSLEQSDVSHSRSDDVDRRLGGYTQRAEMISTMSTTTSEFLTDSDPPTLQIRDQRQRGGRGRGEGPRTPSPDTSVMSSESEVSPGMRMELRQKRRVIEEVTQ